MQQPGAARLGEELGAEADQPAGRHEVVEPDPAGAVVDHLLHPALAQREHLREHADVVLGHVDRQPLDRLVMDAVDVADDHLGLADGELEALAAHQLDEDRELQLAAALDLPLVRALGVLHADRDVADRLGRQAVLDLAGGELVAVLAGQRREVDADGHRDRRLVDGDHRQRARIVGVGQRLADRHVRQPGDGDDLARPGLGGIDAVERLGDVELGDARGRDRAVGAAPGDRLALLDRPVVHAADREPPDVGRRVEVGDVRLQRLRLVVLRRRDRVDQHVHQRLQRRARVGRRERGAAGPGVRVDDRELDLVLGGAEVDEQLVDLVHDLGDPRVRPVDLVHDEDHRQPALERLAQHEARLGEGALGGVDEQEDAVDHRQPALHFAAEVGVTGGVDDVELDAVVTHRGVLGQDRDALLTLQVHRVHHAVVDVLVVPERAGLPQHRVDERGLPVIDVGDDGDVSEIFAASHERRGRILRRHCRLDHPAPATGWSEA